MKTQQKNSRKQKDTPYKDNKIYRSDCIEKVVCPGVRADDFFIKRVF